MFLRRKIPALLTPVAELNELLSATSIDEQSTIVERLPDSVVRALLVYVLNRGNCG